MGQRNQELTIAQNPLLSRLMTAKTTHPEPLESLIERVLSRHSFSLSLENGKLLCMGCSDDLGHDDGSASVIGDRLRSHQAKRIAFELTLNGRAR